MSFAVQEQVMLDLLFESDLRVSFAANPVRALSAYQLDDAEMADFLCVRAEALELDSAIRADLILSQMSRYYPVIFGVLSSFSGGDKCLKSLVDSQLMRCKPMGRNIHFGQRLRQKLPQLQYAHKQEYFLVNAILDAELAMAYTSASLKEVVINGEASLPSSSIFPDNWPVLPISMADYVSASILPLPYSQLKNIFCPCEGLDLWRHLSVTPVTSGQRIKALEQPQIRLLLARAIVSYPSLCEPVIDFVTVELQEGFAPLFQYVDGRHSVEDILVQLGAAGAQVPMLDSIQNRFMELLKEGMLKTENTARGI